MHNRLSRLSYTERFFLTMKRKKIDYYSTTEVLTKICFIVQTKGLAKGFKPLTIFPKKLYCICWTLL